MDQVSYLLDPRSQYVLYLKYYRGKKSLCLDRFYILDFRQYGNYSAGGTLFPNILSKKLKIIKNQLI